MQIPEFINQHLLLQGITLHETTEADVPFLEAVYASTRAKELENATQWNAEQKSFFLQQQFTAQRQHYLIHYPGAFFGKINFEKQDIGRVYLWENNNDIRIVDISILPEWRNKQIGQKVLTSILNFAADQSKKVSIHVEQFNPALNLYSRLGFVQKSITNGIYLLMEWQK